MKSGFAGDRNLRCVLFFWFCFLLLSGCSALENGEVFTEDLFLRPLPDGKVLSHFYFKNTARTLGSAEHHHIFPKAISQLVRKFHISEMELSFTQGRWNYERWGALDPIASSTAKPLGLELWASFDVPLGEVDATWRNLTHALSGLFCASVNFLDSSAMTVAPDFAFGPSDISAREQSFPRIKTDIKDSKTLRYGALPREAVCTENLTPWLKLLPCRDKAGISTLLDRPRIYRGYYHSLRVHLLSGSFGTVLDQTLTLVLQPLQNRERTLSGDLPHWSLSLLFGRGLEGSCPLAKSSNLLLELEGSLINEVQALDTGNGFTGLYEKSYGKEPGDIVVNNAVFILSPYPDTVFREVNGLNGQGDDSDSSSLLLDYSLQKYSPTNRLNVEFIWKEQITWPSSRGPFRVSRFLVGSGNQMGSIVIELKSNYERNADARQEFIVDHSISSVNTGDTDKVDVTIFHIVPWYVRLYLHTLTTSVDGSPMPLQQIVSKLRILPAEDRLSPAVLEMQLQIPVNVSSLSLDVEFDKGFLHIDEHPPDANRGFDLPSAFIRFHRYRTQRQYITSEIVSSDNLSPFLQSLKDAGPIHIYSESLLLPLGTPDFSMPYNVITFTCTVLALYFGSLLNMLRRRMGEEERMLAKTADFQQGGKLSQVVSPCLDGKTATQKKLTKLFAIVIVAAVAIAANQFLEM